MPTQNLIPIGYSFSSSTSSNTTAERCMVAPLRRKGTTDYSTAHCFKMFSFHCEDVTTAKRASAIPLDTVPDQLHTTTHTYWCTQCIDSSGRLSSSYYVAWHHLGPCTRAAVRCKNTHYPTKHKKVPMVHVCQTRRLHCPRNSSACLASASVAT